MKATASFKKFFSRSLNILTQNQYNENVIVINLFKKLRKNLKIKRPCLLKKRAGSDRQTMNLKIAPEVLKFWKILY